MKRSTVPLTCTKLIALDRLASVFKKISHILGRLGSRLRVYLRVSASFQMFVLTAGKNVPNGEGKCPGEYVPGECPGGNVPTLDKVCWASFAVRRTT